MPDFDEDRLREFEYHMEQAADMCRGHMMTEDEWTQYRQLWAGVGQVLAPCDPNFGKDDKPVDKDSVSDDNEAFDRAMDFLT